MNTNTMTKVTVYDLLLYISPKVPASFRQYRYGIKCYNKINAYSSMVGLFPSTASLASSSWSSSSNSLNLVKTHAKRILDEGEVMVEVLFEVDVLEVLLEVAEEERKENIKWW